jgi:predicted Rossmann fold nucleotide-binding protein DprA/Smf involved in DNA uptake
MRDLETGPRQMDDVIHRAGLPPQQVCALLLDLELQGLLKQLPGKRYELTPAATGNR